MRRGRQPALLLLAAGLAVGACNERLVFQAGERADASGGTAAARGGNAGGAAGQAGADGEGSTDAGFGRGGRGGLRPGSMDPRRSDASFCPSQTCPFERHSCDGGACPLACTGTSPGYCGGACQDGCVATCAAGSTCRLEAGREAELKCHDASCYFDVERGGRIRCEDDAFCRIWCHGDCTVECTSKSYCQLQCGAMGPWNEVDGIARCD